MALAGVLVLVALGFALGEAWPSGAGPRPDVGNCTMQWFEQPLDHFNGVQSSFRQRVCVYDKFWRQAPPSSRTDAVLFYTGNEGPVDLYVNNTGLMWDLGRKLNAVLAFAEHRYFGESVPPLRGIPGCLKYVTPSQALADYAMLLPLLKARIGLRADAKVVAFGGSYGGMLAAWFRIKYPHVCTGGAIAGSAPVWGFASSKPPLDGSYRAISHGAETTSGSADPQCHDSFLAAWVLVQTLSRAGPQAREFLTRELRSCQPITEQNAPSVVRALQDVLFLLAESNFPFASDYIVFSILGRRGFPLPPWPMRRACQIVRQPKARMSITGDRSSVRFSARYALGEPSNAALEVQVDWDRASARSGLEPLGRLLEADSVRELVSGVRQVYAMLYNVTGEAECLELAPMDNVLARSPKIARTAQAARARPAVGGGVASNGEEPRCDFDTVPMLDAWGAIVCNEGISLVQDTVRGAGNDMFWPPDVARNESYDDIVSRADRLAFCETAGPGVTASKSLLDPLGHSAFAQYMGRDLGTYASNIVFSNGLYDPWSGAGVLHDQSASIAAVVIDQGAHHTDFMFSHPEDPKCVLQARAREEGYVRTWLGQVGRTPIGSEPGFALPM